MYITKLQKANFILINTFYEKKPNKLCFMCQEKFKANLLQLF